MHLLFIPLLFATGYLFVSLFSEKKLTTFGLLELALTVGISYGIFFAASLPLVWLNHWTVERQMGILLITVVVLGVLTLRSQRLTAPKVKFPIWITVCFVIFLGLGIWRERNPIHYLYATHDPGAYLGLAHHLARTGKFEVRNDLAEMAKTDPTLQPLLGQSEEAPLEWQQRKNYGVIPKREDSARGGFHGFYGTPLMLATGIEIFGEKRALAIQWIHLAATLLLIAGLSFKLTGGNAKATNLAMALYITAPLVHPIFREPLSEPAAGVCFLALLLFGMIIPREEKVLGRLGFFLVLSAALAIRISSLMYLPFVVLFLLFTDSKQLAQRTGATLYFFGLTLTLVTIGLAARISPAYFQDILQFYSEIILKKVSWPILIPVGAAAMASALVMRSKVKLLILNPKIWSISWKLFIGLLGAGVVFRYLRLVTQLTHNLGGYPFVLFNLDSLLFYGSPLVVFLGFGYWLKRLSQRYDDQLSFLQWTLPFILFFYWVYRFIPLNLQPNFQRYLLIEMVPLAAIGMASLFHSYRKSSQGIWTTPIIAFSFGWNLIIGQMIQHEAVASSSYQHYQVARDYLSSQKEVVVIAIAPDWLDMTYLTPLANAFGFAQGYVNFPFSGQALRAVNALQNRGKTVLLAVNHRLLRGESSLILGDSLWREDFSWKDCYEYPKFGLGAPPLQQETRCNDLRFLKRNPVVSTAPSAPWSLAWRDRNAKIPFDADLWLGLVVDKKRSCGKVEEVFSITLNFTPDAIFVPPSMRLNSESYQPVVHTRVWEKNGKRPAHQTELVVPVSDLECGTESRIDIYFGTRKATVSKVEFRPAASQDKRITTALIPRD